MSQFSRKNLTDEESWKNLKSLHEKYGTTLKMRDLFSNDQSRFKKYTSELKKKI